MAENLVDNLDYKGPKPDFTRQEYSTFEAMRSVYDSRMPQMYLTYCLEDNKVYLYNKNNSWDDVTGKFREFPGKDHGGIQKKRIPAASSEVVHRVYQYVGRTNDQFRKGFFYYCAIDAGTYYWQEIDTCEPEPIITSDIDSLFE